MKYLRRAARVLLTAALLLSLFLTALAQPPAAGNGAGELTILFTHDLHSHFMPQPTGDSGETGGYARLKTAIDRARKESPDALLVDGGDFSIGSLIQTLYTTQAAELRTMGAMGYDVTTIGNHEFDHRGAGFAQMLNAAVHSGDTLPALVNANYKPADLDVQRAMAAYGVKDYILLERGGVTYGVFGLMGEDADECAPASGFVWEEPAKAAQRCVDALKSEGAQFILCLSHSGTEDKQKNSEDEQLAKKVSGIDLIISGHTHTTLEQPIVVGDTYIVSSGPYCENLGSVSFTLDGGKKTLTSYALTPIDETLPDDPAISALVEGWKARVSGGYLAQYGFTYDEVLTTAAFDLNTQEPGVQADNALGALAADAFRWAAQNMAAGLSDADAIGVVADGVLRAPIRAGDVTPSMAFDVLSIGVGEDGNSGYPLVSVWLTGKELKAVAEVDASVTPIMDTAQLYLSGLDYSFNVHRMFFNRVTDCRYVSGNNSYELESDKLYQVVTGMYSAEMLGTVKDKSLGLLSLVPKDENGDPITDFTAHILRDASGGEIKEWYALASYLKSFGEDGLPERYSAPDGRKTVSRSWNPIELFRNLNWITLVALLVFILLAAVIILSVRWIIKRRRRTPGGGYRRRRLM